MFQEDRPARPVQHLRVEGGFNVHLVRGAVPTITVHAADARAAAQVRTDADGDTLVITSVPTVHAGQAGGSVFADPGSIAVGGDVLPAPSQTDGRPNLPSGDHALQA